MYIQYLSHIQGVYFISFTAMKACIRHSNDRHRAQENIKGISYKNSVLGQKVLFFTWCELDWNKKPAWHVCQFSIFWLPRSRTDRLRRSSFSVWVCCGTSWPIFTKFSVGIIPMEGAAVVCVLVSCIEPAIAALVKPKRRMSEWHWRHTCNLYWI